MPIIIIQLLLYFRTTETFQIFDLLFLRFEYAPWPVVCMKQFHLRSCRFVWLPAYLTRKIPEIHGCNLGPTMNRCQSMTMQLRTRIFKRIAQVVLRFHYLGNVQRLGYFKALFVICHSILEIFEEFKVLCDVSLWLILQPCITWKKSQRQPGVVRYTN